MDDEAFRNRLRLERLRDTQARLQYHRAETDRALWFFVKAAALAVGGMLWAAAQVEVATFLDDVIVTGAVGVILLVGLSSIVVITAHDRRARGVRAELRAQALALLADTDPATPAAARPERTLAWIGLIALAALLIAAYAYLLLLPALPGPEPESYPTGATQTRDRI